MRDMPPLVDKLVNFALYQVGWFCCVLGGAWGHPLVGGLAALALVGVHLLLASDRASEIKLMLIVCLLGVIADTAQQHLGVFTFRSDPGWPLWLPLWVFVIWAQFATLFHYALHWLQGRYLLASLCGLFGGPLAYWAGVRFGAATWGPHPWQSLACLAIVWAAMTPTLLFCSTVLNGREGRYRWPGQAASRSTD